MLALWRLKQHDKRWTEFIKNCKHPDSHREMEYTYIPNEAIKEPSHEICSLCRQTTYLIKSHSKD